MKWLLLPLIAVMFIPTAFAQVDPEYINRNSIYANEINNQFEPNILYEYIDSDGVIRNDVYEIFLIDEKPDAPFPKYTDLKLGNFPYYQLTFDDGIYQIKSLKENVDVLINPDFCTVHVSNQDEEIIENWQVYSSPWGIDNWQLLPVNDNQCEFEIWNDNQGVYWNFIKENELGKFASGYHYSTWKVESTQSYHNFDQTTLGEIDEDDNIISGNPYKFGFTQNLVGSDFFVDDSFQLYSNIDDELTSSKISYAFADSKDLLWGANENSDGTYFDFKHAKEPTNFNEVLSMDPIWDSSFAPGFNSVRDFTDRDANGRIMMVDYGNYKLVGFNENTGNNVWTENSNGGVSISTPKGGVAAKGSGTSNPYTISQYNSNYNSVSWSFNNNNPTTPSIGSTIQSVSNGRGYDHDYSNSNNWCFTEYMSSRVTCSGVSISGMNYPQSVEWNNFMNWACVSGATSTSYSKGYVFECKDTSGNTKISTYFGNYGTGLHTLIPSSVTSSPVLPSSWDRWDFDDTNGDLHWTDNVNGLVYIFELNPTQTGYVYKDYYGNGMGTGNGQFTNPVAIKLIHNTANTALDYILIADYGVGEVEIYMDIPPPDPPTNLSLSQTVTNQLDLSWSAPTSGTTPTSYQIDRSLDGNTWTTIVANTGSTGTTYSDTGLTLNTNYYYRVFTLANGIPSSTASNTASQTTWNVPDQVTGLTGQTGDPIVLTWTQPNSDDVITNYKIYRDNSLLTTVGNVLTYSDTSVVPGTIYAYQISAVSSTGEGALSSTVNVLAGTPPDPPVISTSINSPNTTPLDITISITPDSNVGTGTLTGFELYRDGSLITTTGLVSTYVDTVSAPGTYQYSAKSVSTHGNSGLSNLSSITTPSVPGTPAAPTPTILDPDTAPLEIQLSFTEPNNGGSNVVGYQIDMWDSINNSYQTITTNTGNTNLIATIQNLVKDTDYKFKIAAINLVGTGSLSAESATITTPDVPTAPTVSVSPISDTELSINWSPNYDGGSNVISWDISLDGTVTNLSSGTTNYIHSGLVSNSTHTYEVRGNNLLGNGAWSASASGTTYPFNPNWISTSAGNIAYSIARDDTTLPEELTLTVLRDVSPTWNLSCDYKTTTQVLTQGNGTTTSVTGVSVYVDTQAYADSETIYITCSDGVDLFSATSHGNIENALSTGLVLFDSLGGFMGAPAVMLMVLAIFSMATPRNAPTVLIIGLAVVGIFGSIGLLYFEDAIWGLLLVCGALGIFGIKRFF